MLIIFFFFLFFFLMIRRPPRSTLFPYTTPSDPEVMPQATAEGARARGAAGRCLPLLEEASRIERQQELLSALVPDERIIALQEFSNRLCRSWSVVAIHRVPIQIRVLDHQIAARRDQRGVRTQFRQDMVFGVARVED